MDEVIIIINNDDGNNNNKAGGGLVMTVWWRPMSVWNLYCKWFFKRLITQTNRYLLFMSLNYIAGRFKAYWPSILKPGVTEVKNSCMKDLCDWGKKQTRKVGWCAVFIFIEKHIYFDSIVCIWAYMEIWVCTYTYTQGNQVISGTSTSSLLH